MATRPAIACRAFAGQADGHRLQRIPDRRQIVSQGDQDVRLAGKNDQADPVPRSSLDESPTQLLDGIEPRNRQTVERQIASIHAGRRVEHEEQIASIVGPGRDLLEGLRASRRDHQ
jgi:hypothetical protein